MTQQAFGQINVIQQVVVIQWASGQINSFPPFASMASFYGLRAVREQTTGMRDEVKRAPDGYNKQAWKCSKHCGCMASASSPRGGRGQKLTGSQTQASAF